MIKKSLARWQLIVYDLVIFAFTDLLLLVFYQGQERLPLNSILIHTVIGCVCIFVTRIAGGIYLQIWRYGGIQCYIRLLFTDGVAFLVLFAFEMMLRFFTPIKQITFTRLLSISCINLLAALAIRMIYRYCFKCGTADTRMGKFLRWLFRLFTGETLIATESVRRIKIAIIGAGRVGVTLAEELLSNPNAMYTPRCFIDVNKEKVGREIHDIPVIPEDETTLETLRWYQIQVVVFAIGNLSDTKRRELYAAYSEAGYKIKVYDYPVMQTAGKKR